MITFYILYTADYCANKLWDHGLSDLIITDEGIKSIDAQYFRDHFMTTEFCEFVYRKAVCSMTRTELNKELRREGSDASVNLFRLVGSSDISWAMMVYLNNEEYWTASLKKKHPEFNHSAPGNKPAPTRATTKRKTKKSARTSEAEEDPNNNNHEDKTVKQRWMNGCLRVSAGDGYNQTARLVYFTFDAALKGIHVDEWKNVWSTYWDDIKDEELKTKRTSKKRTTKNIWEDELVELDLGGGSEDDDDNDDDAVEITRHEV